jgi:hypothetical protein
MKEGALHMGDDQVDGGRYATPDPEGGAGGASSGGPAPDWSDIARQLEALGSSVAAYIKATMDDPETKRHAAEVRAQLERAAGAVGDAMSDAARSEAGQKVYNAATTVAGAAVSTGQKVAEEVRPHLADALRRANEAVRAAAESMTARGEAAAAEGAGAAPGAGEPAAEASPEGDAGTPAAGATGAGAQ